MLRTFIKWSRFLQGFRRRVIVSLQFLCAFGASWSALGQNLLVNGSFEQITGAGPRLGIPVGSTDITGWSVIIANIDASDSLDPQFDPWLAADGTVSLDLGGNPGRGGIEQSFASVPGSIYQLTFSLAGNFAGPPRFKNLQVKAGSVTRDYLFDVLGHSYATMGWTDQSFEFTAENASTTIQFVNTTTEFEGDVYGPAIDNVRVNLVPEPTFAALAIIGGFVLFGVRGKRRRIQRCISPPCVVTTVALLVFASPWRADAQNLILNGSFETTQSALGLNVPVGSTAITGWTVVVDKIDYVDTGTWLAADGTYSVDLAGTPGRGGIEQTFATVSGKTYRVAFALAGNFGGSPQIKQLQVSAAGSSADFTFDVLGHSPTNPGWVEETWDFVAVDSTSTLRFLNTTGATNGDVNGPALDNVRVNLVPEPSFALIATISVLLLRRTRGVQDVSQPMPTEQLLRRS